MAWRASDPAETKREIGRKEYAHERIGVCFSSESRVSVKKKKLNVR